MLETKTGAGSTAVNVGAIRNNAPEELRALRQWVAWKLFPASKEGVKPRKVPFNPTTGKPASADLPATWGSFDEALAVYERGGYEGIGFEFSVDDPYVGVDLDHCRNPETGAVKPESLAIIAALDSYTEVSPSGTGVHIIIKGELPPDGRKRGDVEMYDSGRYFTFTGAVLEGHGTIAERTDALTKLHKRVFGERREPALDAPQRPMLSDEEILDRVLEDEKLARLFAGIFRPEHASQSTADLALCKAFAAYSADVHQIDALFRRSGLIRDKWDERRPDGTYGSNTIAVAVAQAGNGPVVSNYVSEKGAKDGDGKETKSSIVKVQLPCIVNSVLPLFGGKLVRFGEDLHLDDGKGHGTCAIRKVDALFAELQARTRLRWHGKGADRYGDALVSRGELFERVGKCARCVRDISMYPMYPQRDDVYVSDFWEPNGTTDGSCLRTLIDFFAPASEHDKALLTALVLTFFWGGRPGGRPLIVVTGRRGAGKSTDVELLADLVGGVFSPAAIFKLGGDNLAKELLSPPALARRVVLLDNLTGSTSSDELVRNITAQEISGRASHREGSSRLNLLTWVATAVSPALSSDLMVRALPLALKKPKYDATWEPTVRAFIKAHRADIISDAISMLRGPRAAPPRDPTRFSEWCAEVLAVATPAPDAVLKHARGKLTDFDEDRERFAILVNALRAETDMGPSAWTLSQLAEIWSRLQLSKRDATWLGRDLREALDQGLLPEDFMPENSGHGAKWGFVSPRDCFREKGVMLP